MLGTVVVVKESTKKSKLVKESTKKSRLVKANKNQEMEQMNRVFNKMDEKTILVFIHVENICNFLK
jgi:hypothetical protein